MNSPVMIECFFHYLLLLEKQEQLGIKPIRHVKKNSFTHTYVVQAEHTYKHSICTHKCLLVEHIVYKNP